MATRRNIKSRKTFRKSRKTYKKSRRGGANECERLPFSRLSYDELHGNYQKYCTNFMDKNFKNKDCCNTLKEKFKRWTTDSRDFDDEDMYVWSNYLMMEEAHPLMFELEFENPELLPKDD